MNFSVDEVLGVGYPTTMTLQQAYRRMQAARREYHEVMSPILEAFCENYEFDNVDGRLVSEDVTIEFDGTEWVGNDGTRGESPEAVWRKML